MSELLPSHQAVAKKLFDMLSEEPTSSIHTKLDILELIKNTFKEELKVKVDSLKAEQEKLELLLQDKF